MPSRLFTSQISEIKIFIFLKALENKSFHTKVKYSKQGTKPTLSNSITRVSVDLAFTKLWYAQEYGQ